jgi:sigma-B regulation protein RsbU (phosphoserine phosphatase)
VPHLRLINKDGSERDFPLSGDELIIGRNLEAGLRLEGNEISRRHCRLIKAGPRFLIEDLGSSNGTFVNGVRIRARTELQPEDEIRLGPYRVRLESAIESPGDFTILGRTEAATSNEAIFRDNASAKLKAVLDLSQLLASASELDDVLHRLLNHLLLLFPKADYGAVVLTENEELILRAGRHRGVNQTGAHSFSRSVARRAISESAGVLGEDALSDKRFKEAVTLVSLGIHSFLCAPLMLPDGRCIGAVQLTRQGAGRPFTHEDLNLLTAITLQLAAVVENRRLQQEIRVKERMERELSVARQIQESFLPPSSPVNPPENAEFFCRVYPALQVSGDFYDYFQNSDNNLAFAIADVCGKGMPAALFMTMCLTLLRHFGPAGSSPAATLAGLNQAITRNNRGQLFVTTALGCWNSATGEVTLAYGGHPAGLLLRADGSVELAGEDTGSLLGYGDFPQPVADLKIQLASDEALILFTDGVTEALGGKDGTDMFGMDRLREAVAALPRRERAEQWAARLYAIIEDFGHRRPLADDLTLLILRRL